jgi:hypothetical protein
MTRAGDRIVLGLEIVLGAVPITIVGGIYSLLGLVFAPFSILVAVREGAFNVFAIWSGILALALGGAIGIVGLWVMILVAAAARPSRSQLIRVALRGTGIGVATAIATILLMLDGVFRGTPLVCYVLVAPLFVVAHRALTLESRAAQTQD